MSSIQYLATLLYLCCYLRCSILQNKSEICQNKLLYYTPVRCSLVYSCFLPLVPSPTHKLLPTHYGAIYRTKFDGSLLIFSVDILLTDGVVVSSWAGPGNVLSLIASKLSSGLCCQGYGTNRYL